MTEKEYLHLKESFEKGLISKDIFDKATADMNIDIAKKAILNDTTDTEDTAYPQTDNQFLNSLLNNDNDFDMEKKIAKNLEDLDHVKKEQEQHELELQKQQDAVDNNPFLKPLVEDYPTTDNEALNQLVNNVVEETPSNLPYCQNCGTQYKNENQAFCLECGTKKGNGNKYCPECGTKKKHDDQDVCLNCGHEFVKHADFAKEKTQPQVAPVIVNVQNENTNTNVNDNKKVYTYTYDSSKNSGKPVNKLIYILLAVFLGMFGIHRMYAGRPGGILMLLFSWTGIPYVIAWVDIVLALIKPADQNGNIYF